MKTGFLPTFMFILLLDHAIGKTVPNHAIADLVLGQESFTSSLVQDPPSSFTLCQPAAVVIDPVSRKVFVSDGENHRILRYANAASLSNGSGAEAVFGQARFSTNESGSGDPGLNRPRGIFLDRLGRLWVADEINNRVLMFEAAAYRETNAYPDKVFGQPGFTTNTPGTGSSKMFYPEGVWVDGQDRLWVAEFFNNRVLRFDSISTKPNGAPADGVLGQSSFDTATAGVGASGLHYPAGIAVSPAGALFVACSFDNRVLRFDNAASLANGAPASGVLGQTDFTTAIGGLDAGRMNRPVGVWVTPDDTLWVCDQLNHRLLRFENASAKPNGAPANGVVGQRNFTSANDDRTTRRSLASPLLQPFVDATSSLWVPDFGNNRVLRFPPDVTKPRLTVTGALPDITSKAKLLVKGTAADTYGISKVRYRVGNGALKTASGTTKWRFTANLKPGGNRIAIFAFDSAGNKSLDKVIRVTRELHGSPAIVGPP